MRLQSAGRDNWFQSIVYYFVIACTFQGIDYIRKMLPCASISMCIFFVHRTLCKKEKNTPQAFHANSKVLIRDHLPETRLT